MADLGCIFIACLVMDFFGPSSILGCFSGNIVLTFQDSMIRTVTLYLWAITMVKRTCASSSGLIR